MKIAPKPSPKVSDEIRKTTCYMCACRCGINVHFEGGKVKYIEGNRDHPVNRGVLCAKGSAGIMQHYSPARLRAPLKRVGERGSGEFEEISWDEAFKIAESWLGPIRESDPKRLAFFTGRDQSQSFTSFWAQSFGTPNYAAHGGFCSVNMAAAGIYTMGGAFWEFGQPDWERTRLFMLFGVAEDHDSNPIKMGLGKLKARGVKTIAVNPVRTGYNALADEWVGITPGSDGLFILALIHELLRMGKIDLDYLARFTNAGFLVGKDGLFLRDKAGKPLIIDRKTGKSVAYDRPGSFADLGATHKGAKTVMALLAEAYLDAQYAPEAVAGKCGVEADRIRAIAHELARVAFEEEIILDIPWVDWKGEKHERMIGRPVSFHAMRGLSAHSNGFQTARALHILQILLGSVETPGGFRFKPPYPKPADAHPRPHGKSSAGEPLNGPHLGFPQGPEDLLYDEQQTPIRIDKAFTWENPLSVHGLMHMVIANAHAGDPYPIDTLFLYMANMAWNSSMNTKETIKMLTDRGEDGEYIIPHIIYSDAYSSEMVAYSDLILPDTTYLERHDCMSLLDRPISEADAAADAIRWPVVAPDRDVRAFQSVLCELGARLGLPNFVDEAGEAKYRDYADYLYKHERRPGVGPLAGFRGDGDEAGRGAPNSDQIERYKENGGFFLMHIPEEAAYYKPWNAAYQQWAVEAGFYDAPAPYVFNLYSEVLRKFQAAAEGQGAHLPPEHLRKQIARTMTPLPHYYAPLEHDEVSPSEYPLYALTQRPMHMYHSWGSQNAWLRQISDQNTLYVGREIWDAHGFGPGDWARLRAAGGEIIVPVALMEGLNPKTVWTWNAIGKRRGAWALEKTAPEAGKGFLLNHLIRELLPQNEGGHRRANSDPITGQAAWFDLRVSIERVEPAAQSEPQLGEQKSPVKPAPGSLSIGAEYS